jgi:protein-disulfide isomerase
MRYLLLSLLSLGLLTGQLCAPPAPQPPHNNGGDEDEHVLSVGSPSVTVIEYLDFQCPVCGRFFRETYPTIKSEYVDTGKVRWVARQFPLRSIHPDAQRAAEASECAANQDAFFAYHDLLFANQGALGSDALKGYAAQLGRMRPSLTSASTAARRPIACRRMWIAGWPTG